QVELALALTHLAERARAGRSNRVSEGCEAGLLQHGHVLAVPTLTNRSARGRGCGRPHREHVLHPSIEMRRERVELCLPDPCREEIVRAELGRDRRDGRRRGRLCPLPEREREVEFPRHQSPSCSPADQCAGCGSLVGAADQWCARSPRTCKADRGLRLGPIMPCGSAVTDMTA